MVGLYCVTVTWQQIFKGSLKPVFLKVGEISSLGAIFMGKGSKKSKGATGGRRNTIGAKMLNH